MSTKRKGPAPSKGGSKTAKPAKSSTPRASTRENTPSRKANSPAATGEVRQLDIRHFPYRLRPGHIDAASVLFRPEVVVEGRQESRDFTALPLEADQRARPVWVDGGGRLTLEMFHPLAARGQDFLVAIAEPTSRPALMHEYKLTVHSLYAAVAAGLSSQDIIAGLRRWCKNKLPPNVVRFIEQCGKSYGKVKLVLRNAKYFLETTDSVVLSILLQDPDIAHCRVSEDRTLAATIPQTDTRPTRQNPPQVSRMLVGGDDDDDDAVDEPDTHAVRIQDDKVAAVAERCLALQYPALEEYDFRNDHLNADLDIDLGPGTQIRPHQEQSLNKMFGNGRAKSGIVVLPCGAGKTLVGITAACTIKKGVVVLATGSIAATQWRDEFLKWTNINPESVALCISGEKSTFTGNTGVLITTYAMVTNTRARANESAKMMQFLKEREWGLMLLDEVHVAPAQTFRTVIGAIKAHCKLGLTATLLREDDKVGDLNFLIGPKLYEASWTELADRGYIAKVSCAEVWCSMPREFLNAHNHPTTNPRDQALLAAMNPQKFLACEHLIRHHESRGDKILVFSDNLYTLCFYAHTLTRPFLHGQTSTAERQQILSLFRHSPSPHFHTLLLSKIGDTSLDLPEATVLIQLASQFGSRRQEAQRLGRVLRARRRAETEFTAFFYTLVSPGTAEMAYATKRQVFLVDQGYAFRVITKLRGLEEGPGPKRFATVKEREELLRKVLAEAGSEQWRERENMEKEGVAAEGELFHDAEDVPRRMGVKKGGKEAVADKGSFFKDLAREREKMKKQLQKARAVADAED